MSGALPDAGAKILGIDFSRVMVDVVAQRYLGIELRRADGQGGLFRAEE